MKKLEKELKISVIMASYLGEYPDCANNRKERFRKAVNSFLNNYYEDKELIVVSDGCKDTVNILKYEYSKYLDNKTIILVKKKKQKLFSGRIRHAGLRKATGGIICYLDSDDYIGRNHLGNIIRRFVIHPELEWMYFDDYLNVDSETCTTNRNTIIKNVSVEHGSIGSSSIAHRNIKGGLFKKSISWKGCNGYGHDWTFIQRLKNNFPSYRKVTGGEYYICHIPHYFGS